MENPISLIEKITERTNKKRWIMEAVDFCGQIYESNRWRTYITCSKQYLHISNAANCDTAHQLILRDLLFDIGLKCQIIKIGEKNEECGFTYILIEFNGSTLPLLKDIGLKFCTNVNRRRTTLTEVPLLPSFYTKEMRITGELAVPDVDAEFRP